MDNPPASASPDPALNELRAQCDSLQQTVSSLLLVLIVISGTLTIFLMRQWRFVKSELDGILPAATQMVSDYTNSYAMTQNFLKQLAEYGQTHPDFGPVIAKYRLNEILPRAGASPATNSLPIPGTSKK